MRCSLSIGHSQLFTCWKSHLSGGFPSRTRSSLVTTQHRTLTRGASGAWPGSASSWCWGWSRPSGSTIRRDSSQWTHQMSYNCYIKYKCDPLNELQLLYNIQMWPITCFIFMATLASLLRVMLGFSPCRMFWRQRGNVSVRRENGLLEVLGLPV